MKDHITMKQIIEATKILKGIKEDVEHKEILNDIFKKVSKELKGNTKIGNYSRDLNNFLWSLRKSVENTDDLNEEIPENKKYRDQTEDLLDDSKAFYRKKNKNGDTVPDESLDEHYCVLTSNGEKFLEKAEIIVELYEQMKQELSCMYKEYIQCKEKIKIGCIETLSVHYIPDLINRINNSDNEFLKNISFEIITSSSGEIKKLLKNYVIDLGFVTESIILDPDLKSKELNINERPCCICNSRYDKNDLEEIKKRPLIFFRNPSSWRDKMNKWLENKKLDNSYGIHEVSTMETLLQMVANDVGRSVVPSIIIADKNDINKSLNDNILIYDIIEELLLPKVIYREKANKTILEIIKFI